METHKEYILPFFFVFIDYEKAFASVDTSSVVESLEDIVIGKPYKNIIKKIYKKATGTILSEIEKVKIKLG